MTYDIEVVKELYDLANPIIKYRIDRDFRHLEVDILDYVNVDEPLIDYWFNAFKGTSIHGANDDAFENAIGKLLDFGFNSKNHEFNQLFGEMTETVYWKDDLSFNSQINKIVIYPFLIRGGYLSNLKVKNFLNERITMMEYAIEKYGYDLEREEENKPAAHKNDYVFKNDIATECLPTIYDLYAFAYYPNKEDEMGCRIERIIEYILDERFLYLPEKGYVYDQSNKRCYASGNVYHACLREDRKLLTLYLLSFFKASKNSDLFMSQIEQLNEYRNEDGFYAFDKALIKEKKNLYQLYTGGHMGLGENRRSKKYLKIESTFWMMAILKNLE